MRRLLLLPLLLVLAACAPGLRTAGPAIAEPALAEDAFVMTDGAELPMQVWRPAGQPQAVILGLHGMNDYANAFAMPGPHWAEAGIATYAYDQRGFGRGPHPGLFAAPEQLAADARSAIRILQARHPDVPIFVVGVSMGGAVAIAALGAPDAPAVAGTVLVAPALWARSTMPWLYRASLWLGAHTIPGARFTGRSLGKQASDNIEMLRALGSDPLFIKETRVGAIWGLVNLMDAGLANIAALPGPALYLYGAKDEIIPPEATAAALARLEAAGRDDIRFALYEAGWHMLLRDLQRETVHDDIAAWILQGTTPLPSGAEERARERFDALSDTGSAES